MAKNQSTHRLRIYKTKDSYLNFNPGKKIINYIPQQNTIYLSKELLKFKDPEYVFTELNLKSIKYTFIGSNKYGHKVPHLAYVITTKEGNQFIWFNTLHPPLEPPKEIYFSGYKLQGDLLHELQKDSPGKAIEREQFLGKPVYVREEFSGNIATSDLKDSYKANIIANENMDIAELLATLTTSQPGGFNISKWGTDGSKLQIVYDPLNPANTELASFIGNNHVAQAARAIYKEIFNCDPFLKGLAEEHPIIIKNLINNAIINHIYSYNLSVSLVPEPIITNSIYEHITSLVKLVLKDNTTRIVCYETGQDSIFVFNDPTDMG